MTTVAEVLIALCQFHLTKTENTDFDKTACAVLMNPNFFIRAVLPIRHISGISLHKQNSKHDQKDTALTIRNDRKTMWLNQIKTGNGVND